MAYTEQDRYNAVAAWLETGTFRGAAERVGISHNTIYGWYRDHRAEWDSIANHIRELFEEEYRAKWRDLIMRGATEALERLENGDAVLDRSGEIKRVPIKGKDAATIAAIAADKMRLSLGLPTSISARTTESTHQDKLEALRQAARDKAIADGQIAEIKPEMGRAESAVPNDKQAAAA